jgi:gliding motility-associated lipoprotein GldD
MKKNNSAGLFAIFLLGIGLLTCKEKTYTPKPRGFFNIETPEPAYVKFDSTCTYTFEYSKYAILIPPSDVRNKNKCWLNVLYPTFDATIYITYDPVNNNLKKYLDDSHELVYKHVVKSSGIEEALISDPQSKVYGMKYKIDGDAACPYQFYLTDSTQHFFRAALYFNFKPNYDSLYQVLNFIEADMDHMVQTFEWKTTPQLVRALIPKNEKDETYKDGYGQSY